MFIYLADFLEMNSSVTNESLSMINRYSSSSLILQVLLPNHTLSNSTMKTNSTSYLLSSTSINSLVDEINYRNMQILSRIKQCDSDMKFNDICKIYSIDNNTNSLKHPSKIVFYTFEDLVHTLVNLIIVQRLKKFCLSINWCLENLVLNDIVYTKEVLKYYGRSFCTLEQCHSRLSLFIDSCPTHFFSNKVKINQIYFIFFLFQM